MASNPAELLETAIGACEITLELSAVIQYMECVRKKYEHSFCTPQSVKTRVQIKLENHQIKRGRPGYSAKKKQALNVFAEPHVSAGISPASRIF